MNPMTAHTIRTFFAFEIDDAIRRQVNKIIRHLSAQAGGNRVKWVEVNKLHITARFLGEIAEEQMVNCLQQVIESTKNIPALAIEFNQIIMFPEKHPHVIALHIGLTQELAHLLQSIEQAVVTTGLPSETRPFLPHLTLGRLRSAFSPKLDQLPVALPLQHQIDHVTLFRSDFVKNASVYTPIKFIPLFS